MTRTSNEPRQVTDEVERTLRVRGPKDEALGTFQPGEHVDNFRILRLLGRGGMGEVYVARDNALGRRVALKFIRLAPGHDTSLEAIATARLNHPHIVTIHGVGRHGELVYLVLEFVEGQTLRQRLKESPPALMEVLHMGRAMAEAVAAAHGAGVVHRDLKPENVLCGRDGRLRIVDFGVADLVRPPQAGPSVGNSLGPIGDEQTLGDVGPHGETVTGTPAYMAPEQWNNQHGPTADVWALGVVLFELLCGHRPYAEKQPVLLAQLVTSRTPVDLSALEEVPVPVRELVAACLHKDPTRRPDAAQVARRLEELAGSTQRETSTEENPFRGLLAFSERHADAFHGRGPETDSLVEQLRTHPLVGVVGPTGTGKSSLVHAGVLPRMKGGGNWTCLTVRPGADAFHALAARIQPGDDVEALAKQLRKKPGMLGMKLREIGERTAKRVVLVVDQLEEILTLGMQDGARREFLVALGLAADDAAEPVRVLFTLRDDFLGRLAQGGAPRELFRNLVVLRPPDDAMLQQTITRPLSLLGWRLEDDTLAADMVTEVVGEAAALPMLQVAAQVMWERRDVEKRLLTRKSYAEMGGVAGALATHADGVLGAMGPEMVGVTRTLLVRLVTPENTRQVLSRERALGGLGEAAVEALERLVNARLVTVRRGEGGETGDAVELAHESLITRWRQPARWVDESRAVREELADAGRAAARWSSRGRRAEDLWPGPRAVHAKTLLTRPDVQVDAVVHAFVDASRAAQERSQRERRVVRRLLGGTAAVLTVSAVAVALLMGAKEREASRARAVAEQQRADAQREGARAAWLTGDVVQARAKLRTSIQARDSMDARALWWSLSREPLLANTQVGSTAYDAAFSPDGKRVAVSTQAGVVLLMDRQGQTTATLRGGGDQLLVSVFSDDGRTLYMGGWDGEVRAWDLPTRTSRALGRQKNAVLDLAVHGKDVWAATLDGTVVVWRGGAAGEEVPEARGGRSVAVSPDGQRVAVGLGDGRVRLLANDDGRLLAEARGHHATVRAVRFSSDGRRLASGSTDETAALWNATDLSPGPVLRGHRGEVIAVVFVDHDRRLLAGASGGAVVAWNADNGTLLGQLDGKGRITDVEVDLPSQTLVVTDGEGGVRWVDLSLPFPVPWSAGQRGPVYGVDLSPDGKRVASGGFAAVRQVLLWDVDSGRVTGRLEDAEVAHAVRAVRFSPDGKRVAATGNDPVITVWDVPFGPVVRRLRGHTREVRDLAWAPDGKALVSASVDGTVRLFDMERGAEVWTAHGGQFRRVAVSPDGKLVAASADDRTVTLWRRQDGHEVRKLAGHSALVDGVGFSSDGKQLVSGAADGEVWTWDLSTGKGTRLGKRDGRLYSAFFVDGEHVVTAGSAGALESWALSNGNRAAVGTYATEVNRAEPSVDRRWAVVGTDDETVGLWDVVDRAPRWRTAGLLAGPARALTQRGWTTTSGSATTETRFAVGDSLLAQQGDTRCELQAGHHLVAKTSSETWLDVPAVDADALWVTSGACVARRGARVVSWLQGRGERVLAEDAAAVGTDGEAVLVATSSRLLRLHPDGAVLDTAGGAPLVSAVARRAGRWMVGQLDGSVELMGERTLDRVHGRQVTVLAADDGDLVAAGYVDGTVALWHAPSGLLLARDRVHGSVSHLLFDGGALHAATVTGDLTVLPTQVFTRPHCEVISEVAAHVTRGWEDGHLVDLPAPPPCFAL